MKIANNKSAQGVSLASQLLILITSTTNVAYSVARGHPIRFVQGNYMRKLNSNWQ